MVRVAVPLSDGGFCEHFGRCDGLFLCELDPATGGIDRPRQVIRKVGGCDSMPQWLHEMGVQLVLAGGIGGGAVERLRQLGIRVASGYQAAQPEEVVRQHVANPGGGQASPCQGHDHHVHHCRK